MDCGEVLSYYIIFYKVLNWNQFLLYQLGVNNLCINNWVYDGYIYIYKLVVMYNEY
jgi:hypothetical protein